MLNIMKTTELPGMTGAGVAPVQILEVDTLVDRYVAARDLRMEQTRREVEAKQKLIDALRGYADKIGTDKDGTIVYRHEDLIVTLRHGKDELKVRIGGNGEEGENGGDE
jgi:hypothetical protein